MSVPTDTQPESFSLPSISLPSISQPSISQPSISQPSISQPSISQPSISQPSISQTAGLEAAPLQEEPTLDHALTAQKPLEPSDATIGTSDQCKQDVDAAETVLVVDEEDSDAADSSMLIVGIGASAGGLEALRNLAANLMPGLRLAYLVAQHLSPTHPSMLVQLLGRETALNVVEIHDDMEIVPNVVYITPINRNVRVENGRLRLSEPFKHTLPKPSVDYLLKSMADELGENAIAVILSGTGSDGAIGVRAIKGAGGLVFAQDEASARYNGMPRAAFETGCVDLVLPPQRIAQELAYISQRSSRGALVNLRQPAAQPPLERILNVVRGRTRVDFLSYKDTTVQRRIRRRMVANHLATLEEYEALLLHSTDEVDRLAQSLLISVTSFFRDRDAFQGLDEVLGQLLATKRKGEELRIWVPGCATGEEAYSIAILIAERLGSNASQHRVQIFATDLDASALARARRGIFHISSTAELDPALLSRYFIHMGDAHQVIKPVRDMMVFARQDVIQDPPFLHIDLISCRNLLIYFNSSLQARVLEVFHYALRSRGWLFLGRSESTSQREDLFEVHHTRYKLFRRRELSVRYRLQFSGTAAQVTSDRSEVQRARPQLSIQDRALQAAQAAYLPPSVLVDRDLQVRSVLGDTTSWLHFPSGEPNFTITNLVRQELKVVLHGLIIKCQRSRQPTKSHIIHRADRAGAFRLAVHPVEGEPGEESFYLVCFEHPIELPADTPQTASSSPQSDARVVELEDELTATREHLQAVIEELATSNEELQSLNEELQSANQELHATNEEMETSNEELQSTNEELTTVNEELQIKTAELSHAIANLDNIKDGLVQALVVVDEHLRITLFNPMATRLLALTLQDVGTSLLSHPLGLNLQQLREALNNAIHHKKTTTTQVIKELPGQHLMVVQPYYSSQRVVRGAVITLMDNTEIQQAELKQRELERYLLSVLSHSPLLTYLTDTQGRTIFVNPTFCRTFGLEPPPEGQPLAPLLPPELARFFADQDQKVIETQQPSSQEEHFLLNGEQRYFVCQRFPLKRENGDLYAVCMTAMDVTELKRTEKALLESERMARATIDALSEHICVLDANGNIVTTNAAWSQFAIANSELPETVFSSSNYYEVCLNATDSDREEALRFAEGIRQVVEEEIPEFQLEYPCHSPSERRWFMGKVTRFQGEGQRRVVVAHQNITQRKEAELRLQHNERLLGLIVNSTPDFIYLKDTQCRFLMVNQAFANAFGQPTDWFTGKTERELLPPSAQSLDMFIDSIRRHQEAEQRVLSTGETVTIPNDPQLINGKWHTFNTTLTPIRTTEGQIIGLLASSHDVTERAQAERLIQEQASRLSTILDTVVDGIITIDVFGNIESYNAAAEKMFGYTQAEALGRPVALLMPEPHASQHDEYLAHYLSTSKPKIIGIGREVVGRRKNGELFPIDLALSETNLPDRKLFTGILRDITRRKEIEREVLRTRDLAQQASRAKSEFLSQMSHELRTPLNAILGFAQLMEADRTQPLTVRQYENTDQILKAGWHLLELINDVLDLAKVEAGRVDITLEPVNLVEVVNLCEEMILPMASQRGISLRNELNRFGTLLVRADATRLRQMILNLLSNAVKYNREHGSVVLSAEIRPQPSRPGQPTPPPAIRLTVQDSGIGLSPEEQGRIFQPFVRLGALRHQVEGTGIGLVITRRLAELMGGSVGLESSQGNGSTFWLELEGALEGEQAQQKIKPELQTNVPPRLSPNGGPVALYIEDNQANFTLVKQIIEQYTGLSLLHAATGAQGLMLAEEHHPDLILVDIGLPDMDGFQVLLRLRSQPSTCTIPVMALSANALPADIQRGKAAGFRHYFTKPLDMKAFLHELDGLFQNRPTSVPV